MQSESDWASNKIAKLIAERDSALAAIDHLREALQRLADFTESFCDEVKVSRHYRSIESARHALAATSGYGEGTR